MNIGITVYPTYGGSGIVGSELGKELAVRGHTVHFIASSLPTRLTELNERVRFHEVEMMSYPLFEHQPYTLALATKMATVAETENLDLLHVHYAIPHSISAILARESLLPHRRLPVITTLHGTDITLVGADRSYLPITRYGIMQSDGVTAISHYLKQATIETFHFENIAVIPNPSVRPINTAPRSRGCGASYRRTTSRCLCTSRTFVPSSAPWIASRYWRACCDKP
jgi:N-acetyl-alpha-D-glucosaminyl L-malate synthase BshA